MNIQEQIAYYNNKWSAPQFADHDELERAVNVLSRLLEVHSWPRIRPGSEARPTICELGAGTGWFSGILNTFGPTTAIDLSETGMQNAAKLYPTVNFISGNLFEWDYPKESFDIVISQEMIEHVEDQGAFLGIAHGLLRPGGHVILTAPNADTMMAMPEPLRSAWSSQPLENWPTAGGLKSLMGRYFEDIDVRSIIVGVGELGSYRVINSPKLAGVLRAMGLEGAWKRAAARLGYGLHLVAQGRKPLS